jgi:hypothetical protein
LSLEGTGQNMDISPSLLVSICITFLQQHLYCEHVVYLTVRTICRDHRIAFFDIAQTYPELLSALADVVRGEDSTQATKRAILFFLQELMGVRPNLTTVIARQSGVVEAVTHVASSHVHSEDLNSEDDVCNRRILARQARVLSSMIHFFRGQATVSASYSRGEISNSRDEDISLPTGSHHEKMKERIMQLAAVL